MAGSKPEVPDVSIHITSKSSLPAKSKPRKEKTRSSDPSDRKPSKSSKRRRARSPDRISRSPAADENVRKVEATDRTISFRHLFSFGNGENTPKEVALGDVSDRGGGFTLLAGEDRVFVNGEEAKESLALENGGPQMEGGVQVAQTAADIADQDSKFDPKHWEHQRGISSGFVHPSRTRGIMSVDKGNRAPTSHIGDKFGRTGGLEAASLKQGGPYSHSSHMRGQTRDAMEDTPPQVNIPDNIEDNPAAVLAIANNFCRGEKTIEELEREWCEAGGIREQMRRDFKQKRRSRISGRKLGTAGAAASHISEPG